MPPSPYPSYRDHANTNVAARALPFSDGIATLSHPTAAVIAEEKKPGHISRRVAVPPPLSLRPRRVERGPFGRLDDLQLGGSTAVDADVSGVAPHLWGGGRPGQRPDGGAASGWKEGLAGYGARVLALSVYSEQ